jgi:hypothetical protein
MNTDAERKATEIRLRAERRAGQILAEGDKATGGEYGGKNRIDGSRVEPSNPTRTLSDMGISKGQSSRWQKLAQIDDNDFEDALSEKQQTTTGLIKKVNGSDEKMHPKALWLWGRLRDFEREGITQHQPGHLLGEMTETMQSDMARIAPVLIDYLQEIIEEI